LVYARPKRIPIHKAEIVLDFFLDRTGLFIKLYFPSNI